VDLKWLQEQAELARLANLAVMDGALDVDHLKQVLDSSWTLEQIGVRFRSNVPGIVQVESERVFVDAEVVAAGREIFQAQPTLTYLVNSISKGDKSTPYSFVEAGPVPADMRDDQVLVNQWLADQLGVAAGDSLDMAYYQLSASNEFVEQRRSFTVHSVVAMETMRVERELAPRFPGLSDVESCRDWDIGMPMDKDRLADKANEDYWKQYGQTPKLVTTLKAGQEMWGNRFGSVTTVRFSGTDVGESAVREKLRKNLSAERVGLRILPVREQALRAVSQAIDFG
jgi:putative ABC transport system permease protein